MKETHSSETRVSLLLRLRHDPNDREAWNEFVEQYGGKVEGWCRAWGLQEADAQDVTQTVLLKLAVRMRHFAYDPDKSFRAWLKTVARHVWLAFRERQGRPGRGSGDTKVLEQLSSVAAGENLIQRLEEGFDREPPARVVHFLRQLCGALGEAHEAGLVHRDVKPSNVIVYKHAGQYDVVKLLDFGLVRTLHVGDAEATKLTTEGLILGTPEFMSPEQANGSAVLDGRSDLYSLGAVAYFLLTGRSPFAGQTVLRTLVAHLHQPPPPLTGPSLDVPDDVEAIVFRCLAKDPGQRFPDTATLEQALEQCAGANPWTQAQARQRWQTREGERAEGQPSSIPP